MKLAIAVLLLASQAQASPYFRIIDPAHVQQVAGAFVDPFSPGNTSVGSAYAIITHSTRDGCIFPSVICEDWSPLLVGGSVRAGRFALNFGSGFNLTPMAKMGILHVLNAITKADSLVVVKGLLGSQPISGPDVSLSFGPALAVAPIERGIILPINKWTGRFRIFTGAQLKF